MARTPRCRRIHCYPDYWSFAPQGVEYAEVDALICGGIGMGARRWRWRRPESGCTRAYRAQLTKRRRRLPPGRLNTTPMPVAIITGITAKGAATTTARSITAGVTEKAPSRT